jgi:hypothetical protein
MESMVVSDVLLVLVLVLVLVLGLPTAGGGFQTRHHAALWLRLPWADYSLRRHSNC